MKNYVTTIDPFFDSFFLDKRNSHALMHTDIIEKKDHYEMKVNLPGVEKSDVSISLKDGYLTITATYKEDKLEEGRYLYQERSYGEYSRKYEVGDDVSEKDIHAKMSSGVLTLYVAKVSPKEKESSIIHID